LTTDGEKKQHLRKNGGGVTMVPSQPLWKLEISGEIGRTFNKLSKGKQRFDGERVQVWKKEWPKGVYKTE